jgi:hypothetical protein
VNQWVTGAVIVLSLGGGVLLAVLMARDVAAQDRTFGFLAVVEVVLLAQLVVGCVALARTDRDVEGVLFVSYLVGVALALPIGVFWSLAERTRAGTGVLLVAVLVLPVLFLRLHDIWAAHG